MLQWYLHGSSRFPKRPACHCAEFAECVLCECRIAATALNVMTASIRMQCEVAPNSSLNQWLCQWISAWLSFTSLSVWIKIRQKHVIKIDTFKTNNTSQSTSAGGCNNL